MTSNHPVNLRSPLYMTGDPIIQVRSMCGVFTRVHPPNKSGLILDAEKILDQWKTYEGVSNWLEANPISVPNKDRASAQADFLHVLSRLRAIAELIRIEFFPASSQYYP